MRKLTSIVSSLLLMSATAFASTRTANEALQEAESVLKKSASIQLADVETQGNDTLYYIFKGLPNGYAIISANNQQTPILAFDANVPYNGRDAMPAPLQFLLEKFCKSGNSQDVSTQSGNAGNGLKVTRITGNEIEPLLGDITFGQSGVYNANCPTVEGKKCYSGCVATAMAQILKYYNYPKATTDNIPAYTTKTYSIEVPAISKGATLDWDNILDDYSGNYTETQGNAVAKLMATIGTALEMNYSPTGSSSNAEMIHFTKYFGFDTDIIRQLNRWNFSNKEWNEILLDELKAKRPIYILGQSYGGGHAFVIDGINKEGLFHVNWGWDGKYNGFFDITLLCPQNNDGEGASSTSDGYTGNNSIILGIQPDNGKKDPVTAAPGQCKLVNYFSYLRNEDNEYKMYFFPIHNNLTGDYNLKIAAAYVDEDGKTVPISDFIDANTLNMVEVPIDPSKLTEGNTYNIIQLESEDNGETYRISIGSKSNYYTIKYEDGELSSISNTYNIKGNAVATKFNKNTTSKAEGTIHLENTGRKEYYDGIHIYTSTTNTKPSNVSSTIYVTVEAGETNDIPFTFTPSADTIYYWITENYGVEITKGFFVRDPRGYNIKAKADDFFFTTQSDDLKVIFYLSNDGELDYINYFKFYCSPENNLSEIYRVDNGKKYVKVPAQGTAELAFNITDSENDHLFYWLVDADNIIRYYGWTRREEIEDELDVSVQFSGFQRVGDDVKVKVHLENLSDIFFFSDLEFVVNKVDSFPELSFTGSGDKYIVNSEEEIILAKGESYEYEFSFKSESDSIYYYLVDYPSYIVAKGLLLVGCIDYVEMVENGEQPVLWITTKEKTLTVSAVTDAPVTVISANGRLLYKNHMQAGQSVNMHLNAGVYVVNGKKVVVE